MNDLSIRKIPGIGRVNERLLDAIGIKVWTDIRDAIVIGIEILGLSRLVETFSLKEQ